MNTQKTTAAATSSFPVLSVLGIAFVVLKLCGVINWSWWWVTAPFWALPAILLAIAAGCFAVWVGLTIASKPRE